jgi:deoxyribodipyrimidine photo-lyase
MTSVHIFRRDLRTHDNTALIECFKQSKKVYCVFIMTPEQLVNNPYKSERCVYFMYETLKELDETINNKMNFCYGNTNKIVEDIINKVKPENIFFNKDYSKFSLQRDSDIEKMCNKYNVKLKTYHDLMLNEPNKIKTSTGKKYVKFTPYYNKSKKYKIDKPQTYKIDKNKLKKFSIKQSVSVNRLLDFTKTKGIFKGGRKDALKTLSDMSMFKAYDKKRNFMNYKTTHLSAHNKFGTISIRELYYAIGKNETLIRQLYWRDFYTSIGYFDKDFVSKRLYQPKEMKWDNRYFNKWKDGKTGIPIVDATMRELNQTGYCHNRGRLIASGFAKFALIDWKKCEKYYATQLIDYDIFANHYNWNWSFSFGPFSTPWFRIMNVYIQGKNYDKECEYIKKWIPELKDVDNKDIHKWEQKYIKYKNINYPSPILDYKSQREKCYEFYKKMMY